MNQGSLANAHVGNCDYSGGYGVGQGWWHEYVIIIGNFETGEGIEYWTGPHQSPTSRECCTIDVLMPDGNIIGFAPTRLEAV